MMSTVGETGRQGARTLGMWWFGKGDGDGGVEVVVKEVQCEKLAEVRRVSNRVMTIGIVNEEDVLRNICGYAPQCG